MWYKTLYKESSEGGDGQGMTALEMTHRLLELYDKGDAENGNIRLNSFSLSASGKFLKGHFEHIDQERAFYVTPEGAFLVPNKADKTPCLRCPKIDGTYCQHHGRNGKLPVPLENLLGKSEADHLVHQLVFALSGDAGMQGVDDGVPVGMPKPNELRPSNSVASKDCQGRRGKKDRQPLMEPASVSNVSHAPNIPAAGASAFHGAALAPMQAPDQGAIMDPAAIAAFGAIGGLYGPVPMFAPGAAMPPLQAANQDAPQDDAEAPKAPNDCPVAFENKPRQLRNDEKRPILRLKSNILEYKNDGSKAVKMVGKIQELVSIAATLACNQLVEETLQDIVGKTTGPIRDAAEEALTKIPILKSRGIALSRRYDDEHKLAAIEQLKALCLDDGNPLRDTAKGALNEINEKATGIVKGSLK